PRVTCRITPVADICRDRPCLTERLREGATGSKGNWLRITLLVAIIESVRNRLTWSGMKRKNRAKAVAVGNVGLQMHFWRTTGYITAMSALQCNDMGHGRNYGEAQGRVSCPGGVDRAERRRAQGAARRSRRQE